MYVCIYLYIYIYTYHRYPFKFIHSGIYILSGYIVTCGNAPRGAHGNGGEGETGTAQPEPLLLGNILWKFIHLCTYIDVGLTPLLSGEQFHIHSFTYLFISI